MNFRAKQAEVYETDNSQELLIAVPCTRNTIAYTEKACVNAAGRLTRAHGCDPVEFSSSFPGLFFCKLGGWPSQFTRETPKERDY